MSAKVLFEARLLAAMPPFSLATGQDLPTEIQWMPPGEHDISALNKGTGKEERKRIRVDASVASRLSETVEELRASALQGQGDLPYLDFNHDDAAAAARVLAIKWGGDDPKSGGVRAEVEWTGPGKAALEGKAFRRFSPSFFVDAEGRVAGAPINMGGLVNRAAFKTIQPIVAGAAEAAGDSVDPMENDKLATELAAARQTILDLQAKLAQAESTSLVKAKDEEITTLKGQVTALNAKLADQAKANAKILVDAAIKDGRLAPQATELHAKWITTLASNPDAVEMLNSMPRVTVAGQIIQAKAQDAGSASDSAEGFANAVKAEVASGKSTSQAIDLVIAKQPEAYRAWRAANGKPGL